MKRKKKSRKYTIRYQANIPDRKATIKKARKLGIKVTPGGGRPTRGGEPSETGQFVLNLEDLDSTVEINSKSGIIQLSYPSLPKLKKCVQKLRGCYISQNGKKFTLKPLGPDDPLDTSFELTTIDHWQHSDQKYAIAKVHVYQWWDPETNEAIFRIPNREGRVNIPGTNYEVKSTYLGSYLKKCPYVYQGYIPVSIHVIDKDDENGNRIVTAEKARWQVIQELKRIAREHPRLKLRKKN